MTLNPRDSFASALRVIDDVWTGMRATGFYDDDPATMRVPDIGIAAFARRAALGRDAMVRIAEIDAAMLPHDLPLTLEVARQIAERWTCEEDWYWLVFDPMCSGFYTMFAPTPYCGGFLFNAVAVGLGTHAFEKAGDVDRYVGLVRDYGRMTRQMLERTRGQVERGVVMPRAQLDQAVALIGGFADRVPALLAPAAARLASVDEGDALARIAAAIADDVTPAFAALSEFLQDDAHAALAPEAVGLSQYPGGLKAYEALVRMHTTLDLTPREVHDIGLARMEAIHSGMYALLTEAGFGGTPAQYLEHLAGDSGWRAADSAAIGAVFQRYIDRIAPQLETSFNFRPKAGYGVEPLPETLTKSMTFGYYAAPSPTQERGIYFFNTPNLAGGALSHLGPLNYHELVPGHHFHLATQLENQTLHPIRQKHSFNAFNEGWAEYAAMLAGELGMYAEPEERFGRLVMDAFLTCRLVVDTGMNAMGWSLERARDYLRENAFMPESEIRSESIRYSCDIPGQALAYKLGDTVLHEARQKMRAELGERFDIRDFHDAVLGPGSIPLPLVRKNVEAATRRIAAARRATDRKSRREAHRLS